jgi:tetratricopeptide (TPR) repeat protein
LLHNLIDFSLFEAGPMFLFAMVMGSALGLRQPSLAGKRKQTAVAICIFSAATVFWVFAAIIFWGRTAMAESAAGEGDRLVRLAAKAGSQEINPALLQAAAAQYATARKRQPLEGEYAYKEAQVLVSLGADALWVRGLLETACTANPYSGKYFAAKAQYELSRAGVDHQPVKEAYQRMLELDPRNVAARLDYAEALLKMGEDGAALDQFKEALRQNDALPADEPKRLSAQRREELEKQIARLAR